MRLTTVAGQLLDEGIDRPGDGEIDDDTVAAEHLHALDGGECVDVDRTLEGHLELPQCSRFQRGDIVDRDDAPFAQHGNARCRVLDLGQHV